MKANKDFYNTLREEVRQDKILNRVQKVFQTEDNVVVELTEKVKGLLLQIEMLEKRNMELMEKNKELEAMAYPDFSDFEDYQITEEQQKEIDEMNEAMENLEAIRHRRGYIALSAIVKWANEGTTKIEEARLIKDLLHNVMPIMTDEERSDVNNIGYLFREANMAIPQTKIEFQNSQISMQSPHINGPMCEIKNNSTVNLGGHTNG
ncbi:MAG: hypothetical protein II817_10120 [Bacteroidales bacterium]|nr:hypothetical protein [Bacteroidales bacterium]